MTDAERLEDLRRLFLDAPEEGATRWVAVLGALGLTAVILWLVRRRTLREEYTPIWLGVAAGVLALGLSRELLHGLTRVLGAWSPSSTVFFLGQAFLVAICLNYAVRLSALTLKTKNLAQEVALLRDALERRDGGPAASAVVGPD
jgi:hypothetical protein